MTVATLRSRSSAVVAVGGESVSKVAKRLKRCLEAWRSEHRCPIRGELVHSAADLDESLRSQPDVGYRKRRNPHRWARVEVRPRVVGGITKQDRSAPLAQTSS